jgi:hypothetical protein
VSGWVPQWYVSPGVYVAAASGRDEKRGAAFGAELSFSRFPIERATWAGGFVDVVRDVAKERTRIALGPQIGLGIFGIDGGVRLSGSRVGWTVRPMLSFLYVHATVRISRDTEGTGVELGLLFKLPRRLG